MTALAKLDGGVRGIVAGRDQEISGKDRVTTSCQNAFRTKAGVDCIGAFDWISHKAMLEGLMGGNPSTIGPM